MEEKALVNVQVGDIFQVYNRLSKIFTRFLKYITNPLGEINHQPVVTPCNMADVISTNFEISEKLSYFKFNQDSKLVIVERSFLLVLRVSLSRVTAH